MENPSTWKRAELVIMNAIAEWRRSSGFGSMQAHIAHKLRETGLLKDQHEPEIGWERLRQHRLGEAVAPVHDYQMPHDARYGGNDPRGCPPNCPYGKWRREAGDAGAS